MFIRLFRHVPRLTSLDSIQRSRFHLSISNRDLNEFFEDPKILKDKVVRVGRQWHKDDLRTKSNEDLHKLWYVLLKERNMLMTMEHAYKQAVERYPNPERLDKVEESMENIEYVVRERNRAYFEVRTYYSDKFRKGDI